MRISTLFRLLRSLPASVYFNFHYLPLRQAVKLPIMLYKPRFLELKGTVRIEGDNIRTGMIQLGFPTVSRPVCSIPASMNLPATVKR